MYEKDSILPTQCGKKETKVHYIWYHDSDMPQKQAWCQKFYKKKALNTYPGMATVISNILTLGFRISWTDSLNNDTSLDTLLLMAVKTQ